MLSRAHFTVHSLYKIFKQANFEFQKYLIFQKVALKSFVAPF